MTIPGAQRNITINPGGQTTEPLFDASNQPVQVLAGDCPKSGGQPKDPDGHGASDQHPEIAAMLRFPEQWLDPGLGINVRSMVDVPTGMRARLVRSGESYVLDSSEDPDVPERAGLILPSRLRADGSAQLGPFAVSLPDLDLRDLFHTDEAAAALIVFPTDTV